MKIQKFKAKTLKNAIVKMKKEFGDEAIVLSTQVLEHSSNGIEQKYFEITASIDVEETYESTENKGEEKPKTNNFQTEIKRMTEKIYGISGTNKPVKIIKEKIKSTSENKLNSSLLKNIKNNLMDKDVNEKSAEIVTNKLLQYSPFVNNKNIEDHTVSTIASMIPTSNFELTNQSKPKVISLVGPTGVGKTTCIAKLAVISKILHNLNIGLISIDTYRLGALDQLKIFSEISNIDFLVAYEPSDITKFMKKFRNKDIVFIDTVGRSQNNTKLLNSINHFLNKVKVDETYLVLNSTSDYKVMLDVAQKFKVLNYDGLIFSKLDEAISFGNIFNLVSEIKTPIKYLTNGQVIPDDIIAADSDFIAKMVYTGKFN